MSNTIKTIVGFVKSWVSRRVPIGSQNHSLTGIYNYVPIEDLFPTSGQPSEAELAEIGKAGFSTVINLAPSSVLENSVIDEEEILSAAGVNYVHLPVDFAAPSDEDFERFTNALDQVGNDKVWVHCAANMRVSAFVYRYRVTVLNQPEQEARRDLEKIWEPFGVWKGFIGEKSGTD